MPDTQKSLSSAGVKMFHSASREDGGVAPFLRTQTASRKSSPNKLDAKPRVGLMAPAPGAMDASYVAGVVGGVSGVWCRPESVQRQAVLLYMHDSTSPQSSAQEAERVVGQFAVRMGMIAFIANCRLTPDYPFSAAVMDAEAVYEGLVELGMGEIAIAGEAQGGGLALALLCALQPMVAQGLYPAPVACIVVSPQTGHMLKLYSAFRWQPPVQIHVSKDEDPLEDVTRYVARAKSDGVEVSLKVWEGSDVAEQAISVACRFLSNNLPVHV